MRVQGVAAAHNKRVVPKRISVASQARVDADPSLMNQQGAIVHLKQIMSHPKTKNPAEAGFLLAALSVFTHSH